MLWAGVKSENLATIALTSELVDKLNFEEFKTSSRYDGSSS